VALSVMADTEAIDHAEPQARHVVYCAGTPDDTELAPPLPLRSKEPANPAFQSATFRPRYEDSPPAYGHLSSHRD